MTAAELRLKISPLMAGPTCTADEHPVRDRTGTRRSTCLMRSTPWRRFIHPPASERRQGNMVTVRVGVLGQPVTRRVALVKMDVEKLEDAVLRGINRIVSDDRPAI